MHVECRKAIPTTPSAARGAARPSAGRVSTQGGSAGPQSARDS